VAGREAANKALEAAGILRPDFVFMFATVGYDQQVLLGAVRDATGGAPLCGCSGEGIIAGAKAEESSFCIAVMAVCSDQLTFRPGVVTGLKSDPAGAGRAIAQAIQPDVGSDALALFLFPDGITVNFDRLQASLEGALDLDRLLPIVGGTAGDNMAFERAFQYCNDQVVSDGVAWALLSGKARIAWAVSHTCVPIGVEHTVTRSQGNVIYEIDGRPMLDALKAYLTEDVIEDWAQAVLSFPLGFKVPGEMRGYDEYIIRGMVGGRDDVTGSVTIPTEMSEGTSVWLMRRDQDKLLDGVGRVVGEIRARLEDKPARLVFQFDCAGRGKIFLREQQRLQLQNKLRGSVGQDVPWLGFYTFGEISPVGGRNYFHNYTVVLTVVY
jgi:hypothetical protein